MGVGGGGRGKKVWLCLERRAPNSSEGKKQKESAGLMTFDSAGGDEPRLLACPASQLAG